MKGIKIVYFVVILFFIFITHELTHYQINEYYHVESNEFKGYYVQGDFSVLTRAELISIRELHSWNEIIKDVLLITAMLWLFTERGKND